MSENPRTPHTTRRHVLQAAAWATPTIAVAAAAPAMAATPENQRFAVEFANDGGGINGRVMISYLNLGMIPSIGRTTLTQPITVRFDVVGLMATATATRDFSASSSFGKLTRGSYNQATQTTPFTWTIPAGQSVNTIGLDAGVPDVLFNWRDGTHRGGLITNKIVVRSITGGMIVQPTSPPIDSSVVGDRRGGDGIY